MEDKGYASARSGCKRTQVGTTNRSSGLSSRVVTTANNAVQSDDRCRSTSADIILPRSASTTDGGSSRSSSTLRSARETLCTSRSMPSLGTSRELQRLKGEREKENERDLHGVHSSSTDDLAEREDGTPTVRSVGNDSYMTSTQMAYMTGLHPPPSNVPVMDPYRHRQLLHDRWINRASQRLGDIATLKYGSIREFFRLYDSKCDGVLDFDEFSEGITMCQLDHLFPRSLQRTLFDKIDTNKSGSIELNEFAAFLGQSEDKGAAAGELSVWQKQEVQRKAGDAEARSVALQPIQNHKAQRIKNKLSNCLNKAVPNASAGLADNRTMFLRKQFAFLSEQAVSRGIRLEDLVQALGPRGMNLGVSDEDLQLLVKEMDTNSDGNVTLKEFSAFINLDDHEPLYQPLFDGRRRNVNILQSMVEDAPPAESPEEAFFRVRADQLHSEAVPSKGLDREVRVERDRIAQEVKAKHSRGRFARPDSPAWTVGGDTITISTPSGQSVVDVWDLPPPTRHLSTVKRSLTSSMRHLPRTAAKAKDGASVSFASEGGKRPFVTASPQESLSPKNEALASLSSAHDLFSSLEQGRLEDATAGALARARKVAKQTWVDIGHGGIGINAGTDECSSYYAGPSERFTTTNSERYAPLIKMKKIEKGQRSAGFCRQRLSDSASAASLRQQKSKERSSRVRAHMERIALSVKTEEVAARLKEERRIRGKARTRLRYNQWVNSMDNWLSDEVPKLADYNKRQFPTQNIRLRGGQQVHEALGGPMAMAV
ncbi:unnamed protein product [Scytosiphon promiscuus]